VPHPTTLMKLTTRCGEDAVAGLNEALLARAVGELVRTAVPWYSFQMVYALAVWAG
jgi:hypothetical protein